MGIDCRSGLDFVPREELPPNSVDTLNVCLHLQICDNNVISRGVSGFRRFGLDAGHKILAIKMHEEGFEPPTNWV